MKLCSLHRLHTFNEFCSCYQNDEILLSPKENNEGNAASSLKKEWVTQVSDQSDTKSVGPHQIFTRVRRGQIPQPLSDSNVLAIECLHRLNLMLSDYLDGCKNTHFIFMVIILLAPNQNYNFRSSSCSLPNTDITSSL